MMNEVRWGFIGCGDVTEIKSGPAFAKIPGSKVVAVMRRNGDKAADYARRHGIAKHYTRAEALMADPEVNAVYVATPPGTHAHYAIMAAEMGKPCYVEKPMALNTDECHSMAGAFGRAGVPLFIAYYRRALPYFLKIKELIQAGAIGKVCGINVHLSLPPKPQDLNASPEHWRICPEVAGGGHFHDLASHQFDFLNFLFGPALHIKGITGNAAQRYTTPDTVAALWQHPGGITASGYWCFAPQHTSELDQTEITGSTGRIRFSFFSSHAIVLENTNGLANFNIEHPAHVQQPMIENVVSTLLGNPQPICTAHEGLHATRCLDNVCGIFEK